MGKEVNNQWHLQGGWRNPLDGFFASWRLVLIGIGLYFQGAWGFLLAVVGVVPVLAGVFNFCVIAPFLGVPFCARSLA